MLRNLNLQYPGGERRIGLCTTGVLGSTIPSTGPSGPAWMYPSLRFPAASSAEYAYWIEAHNFPSGLPLSDTSAGTFSGLPDGVYAAAVTLEENGVYAGAFPVVVTVGAGVIFSMPTGAVVLDKPEPTVDVLQPITPQLGGAAL